VVPAAGMKEPWPRLVLPDSPNRGKILSTLLLCASALMSVVASTPSAARCPASPVLVKSAQVYLTTTWSPGRWPRNTRRLACRSPRGRLPTAARCGAGRPGPGQWRVPGCGGQRRV
jgi:hypothetical protein